MKNSKPSQALQVDLAGISNNGLEGIYWQLVDMQEMIEERFSVWPCSAYITTNEFLDSVLTQLEQIADLRNITFDRPELVMTHDGKLIQRKRYRYESKEF